MGVPMKGIEPVKQYIMPESRPKDRKEVIMDCHHAIIEANKGGTLNARINAEINFITEACPEIKDGEKYRLKIPTLEPTLKEARKEYMDSVDLLIPEMSMFYESHIQRYRMSIFFRRLQMLRGEVARVLKEDTDWYFSDTDKPTTTR